MEGNQSHLKALIGAIKTTMTSLVWSPQSCYLPWNHPLAFVWLFGFQGHGSFFSYNQKQPPAINALTPQDIPPPSFLKFFSLPSWETFVKGRHSSWLDGSWPQQHKMHPETDLKYVIKNRSQNIFYWISDGKCGKKEREWVSSCGDNCGIYSIEFPMI